MNACQTGETLYLFKLIIFKKGLGGFPIPRLRERNNWIKLIVLRFALCSPALCNCIRPNTKVYVSDCVY